MHPLRNSAPKNARTTRLIIAASDQSAIEEILSYLPDESYEVVARRGVLQLSNQDLSLAPDAIIAKVRSGQEMNAYQLGRAATENGLGVLFVTKKVDALAVQAMAAAVPQAALVNVPCGQRNFIAELALALSKRAPLKQGSTVLQTDLTIGDQIVYTHNAKYR